MTRREFLGLMGAGTAAGAVWAPGLARGMGSGGTRVWALYPVGGVKYARADREHMRNKVYPSRRAAYGRLPHRGFRCEAREVLVSGPLGKGAGELFGGRRDLDLRVKKDMEHLGREGWDAVRLRADLAREWERVSSRSLR